MPDADELAGQGRPFRYEPLYCFYGHHLWEVFPEDNKTSKKGTLKKYYSIRKKKVNMRRIHQMSIIAQSL
jgi:hypothetical protein